MITGSPYMSFSKELRNSKKDKFILKLRIMSAFNDVKPSAN